MRVNAQHEHCSGVVTLTQEGRPEQVYTYDVEGGRCVVISHDAGVSVNYQGFVVGKRTAVQVLAKVLEVVAVDQKLTAKEVL